MRQQDDASQTVSELVTQRLVLRVLNSQSAELCCKYAIENREHFAATAPYRTSDYYGTTYWENRLSGSWDRLNQKNSVEFFVFEKSDTSRIVGDCTFDKFVFGAFQACYLGYNLDKTAVGRGYMTEALQAAIPFVFSVTGVHRIMANYVPTNARSAALLKRLGFRVEGYARDYLYLNEKWQDHILTALHTDDWAIKE